MHSYNKASEEKVKKMMEITFQERTEAKIKWALRCYSDWREMHLDRVDYEDEVYDADLVDTSCLTKENLEFVLCRFICEVKKSRVEGDYPGSTLYQMTCALQNHLKKKGFNWKLVHGEEFSDFQRVLDKVMQEHAASAIGTVKRQAQFISMDIEKKLWEKNILGEENPEKLRNMVLYLVGINCAL